MAQTEREAPAERMAVLERRDVPGKESRMERARLEGSMLVEVEEGVFEAWRWGELLLLVREIEAVGRARGMVEGRSRLAPVGGGQCLS